MIKDLRRLRLATTLVVALASVGCLDEADTPSVVAPEYSMGAAEAAPVAIDVYTQNLFLGGDTGPLFRLDLTDPAAIGSVIAATSQFWADVQASDIPGRAAEFVNEIDDRRPAVVALQEAVGYATGMLNPATGQFTPTAPGPDLLLSVLNEIAARGLPYSVAGLQETTGLALPIGPPTATGLPALGVQDRVVVLKRDDVTVTESASGLYTARIPLGPVQVVRGWVRLSTEVEGGTVHYVATHLETQGSGPTDPIRQVHDGQAFELRNAVLGGLDGTTVLMGDLNSDAAADPSAPSWTATYGSLVDDGFIDVWASAPRATGDTGATCCQADGIGGRTPDERIDFVLLRAPAFDDDAGLHRGWFRADVVGDEEADRTPGGLWPSDHAGVVASIRLPGSPF